MKIKIAAIILCILLVSCTANEDSTIRILENEGYTNISLTGYDWFGCGKEDISSVKFTAEKYNPYTKESNTVTGTVCKGVLKGYTIRYE